MNKIQAVLRNVRLPYFFLPLAMLGAGLSVGAQSSTIQHGFKDLPDSVKPSVYWYWLNDHISEEGVRRDIAAMAKVGIGRAFIGNIQTDDKRGDAKLFSEAWWKVTRAAIAAGTKEGVDIGLFNGPGWSQSGGPWIRPDQSMRYLAGEDIHVSGATKFVHQLKAPPKDFQDVAVIAYRAPASEEDTLTVSFQTDRSLNKADTLHVNMNAAMPLVARSLWLFPSSAFSADMELQVRSSAQPAGAAANSAAGYKAIATFRFDRSNTANNVGFIPYAPLTIGIPNITGTEFRLVMRNIEGTPGLSRIRLSAAPALAFFEEKQLAKMFPTPLPLWNEYQWPRQPDTNDPSTLIDPASVVDLTKSMSADGTLTWDVPPGDWIVTRYGMLPTGVTNAPASP